MNAAEENAQNRKLEKETHRKFSTTKGFYDEYFLKLRTAKSNTEAFKVNEDYYGLFGHYRYSDWNTFKRMTNYNNKKIIMKPPVKIIAFLVTFLLAFGTSGLLS
jgi:hypothetical protein